MTLLTLLILAAHTQGTTPAIPSWDGLQKAYEYRHFLPGMLQEAPEDSGGQLKVELTFPGASGDTVHGILVIPKSAHAVPCVVLLHGLSDNKEGMVKKYGAKLIAKGIGYAAIDAPGHGQRATLADKTVITAMFGAMFSSPIKGDLLKAVLSQDKGGQGETFLARAVTKGVIDNRHLLDYLASRRDIDSHRIGVIGDSMGSIMATILGSVDTRISSEGLGVGGDPVYPLLGTLPTDEQQLAIPTCCSLYAPHFMRPVLMASGSHDTVIPRDATDRLYSAFPEGKKKISWYASDHFLPAAASQDIVDWMIQQLGPHSASKNFSREAVALATR